MVKEGEIKRAILRKAVGETLFETQEEYAFDEEGEAVLKRRKVTKKETSPDLAALKLLLAEEGREVSFNQMTDAELQCYLSDLKERLKEEKSAEEEGDLPKVEEEE